MKRGLVVTVAGAAVLVAGLSGCSNNNKSTSTTTAKATTSAAVTTTSAAGSPPSATAGAGSAKVTIDGQAQKNVQGQVVCATAGGNLNIAIGEATTGIAAVLSADASSVQSVGLGNVNGVTLGYTAGVPGGGANATATKDGNTYKISGTATGVDMANPMQPVTKPFEIQVTCP